MDFRSKPFETDAEEAARLAEAPEGSKSRMLSGLPVTIDAIEDHPVIALPHSGSIVVVPTEPSAPLCDGQDRFVHNGGWRCRVVASKNPSYPTNGYNIFVSAAELRRGRSIDISFLLDTGDDVG